MAWRLANSLVSLRDKVNTHYPNRSRASDGTIGDAAHSSRVSQHNPNSAGVVTAVDITHDPVNGYDGQALADRLIRDPRVWYVIFNRRIWEGKWTPYSGSNPHDKHVHVSVKQDPANYDNSSTWNLKGEEMFNEGDRVNINTALYGKDTKAHMEEVGRPFKDAIYSIINSPHYQGENQTNTSLQQTVKDLQAALANEQAKPPIEVIKEVPVDEKQVVEGFFKRIWNSLFNRKEQ